MDIHHVKFIEYMPSGIAQLSLHPDKRLLAVGRNNGSIEIWHLSPFDVIHSSYLIWSLPANKDRAPRALLWIGSTLISAGLDGKIIQWSLESFTEIQVLYIDSPIWSLATNHNRNFLASGDDNGLIKLIKVNDSLNLELYKDLQRVEGRVLSLSWHPESKHIVCGLDSAMICIFSISTGLCQQRISLDKETKIWQVKVLSDFTIISGDSTGKLHIWSGEFGTLKQSFSLHQNRSDILSICVSNDETFIAASGVDSKIVSMKCIELAAGFRKWIPGESGRVHTHDVTSISCRDLDCWISGGVDSKLVFHSWNTIGNTSNAKILYPISRISTSTLNTSCERKVVLFAKDYKLQLWKLSHDLSSVPDQLDCALEVSVKSSDGVWSCAISDDANILVWSNIRRSKFLSVVWNHDDLLINCVKPMECKFTNPCYIMKFLPRSHSLVVVDSKHQIHFLKEIENTMIRENFINIGDCFIVSLVFHQSGELFAVADVKSRVTIINVENFSTTHQLPADNSHYIISITFFPSEKPKLAVSYSNHSIVIFDCFDNKYSELSRLFSGERFQNLIMSQKTNLHSLNIAIPKDDRFILWDYNGMIIISLDFSSNLKKRKRDATLTCDISQLESRHIRFVEKYNFILKLDILNNNEMVLVRRPWNDIEEQLPPSLYRIRYGT